MFIQTQLTLWRESDGVFSFAHIRATTTKHVAISSDTIGKCQLAVAMVVATVKTVARRTKNVITCGRWNTRHLTC